MIVRVCWMTQSTWSMTLMIQTIARRCLVMSPWLRRARWASETLCNRTTHPWTGSTNRISRHQSQLYRLRWAKRFIMGRVMKAWRWVIMIKPMCCLRAIWTRMHSPMRAPLSTKTTLPKAQTQGKTSDQSLWTRGIWGIITTSCRTSRPLLLWPLPPTSTTLIWR